MESPSILNQINSRQDATEEPELDIPTSILPDKIEEGLINNKWKWRKAAYEALNDLLNEDQDRALDIAERNLSTLFGEKNLAAFEQVLQLVHSVLELQERARSFEQFVLGNLLDNIPHKKFMETYATLVSLVFEKDSGLVLGNIFKRLETNDANIHLYVLSLLSLVLGRMEIDSPAVVRSLVYKLKRFLASQNVKVRDKAMQIYSNLMSYVLDDFDELESGLFGGLKANQSKVIKGSWQQPKRKSRSFYVLEGSGMTKNNSGIGLIGSVNQNMSLHTNSGGGAVVPDKFFETPYAKDIDIKKDILNEFLANLKKHNGVFSFAVVASNTATMFTILINELAESNYLIFSIALEIIALLMANRPDQNPISPGIVKRAISESAAKFNFKASINDLIMQLIDAAVANRHIKFSSFLPFILNEIKFNKSLNVRVCYLTWLSNNLSQHLKDPEVRDFNAGRTASSKDLGTITRKSTIKKGESSLIDYIVGQLGDVLKEEKSVKVQGVLKSHIQEIKGLEVSDAPIEQKPAKVERDTADSEKLRFYLKNVKIPSDNKNKLNVLETCLGIVNSCDMVNEKLVLNTLDFLDRINEGDSVLSAGMVEVELKILSKIDSLDKFKQEVFSLASMFVLSVNLDKLIEFTIQYLDLKKLSTGVVAGSLARVLEKDYKNLRVEEFVAGCKKGLKLLTSLPSNSKTQIYPLIEALEDVVLSQRVRTETTQPLVPDRKQEEKTPLSRLTQQIEGLKTLDDIKQFNSIITRDIQVLQALNGKVQFIAVSSSLERLVSETFAKNLQEASPLAELIVVLLSLLDESGKDKFFVVVLIYCAKEDFCSSLLIYPFIRTVRDIFRCFKFSFNIIRNSFNDRAQANYVKNVLPIYLSSFDDADLSITNKRLMHLAEAMVYGHGCATTSGLCADVIAKLVKRHGVDEVRKRFEVELRNSGQLYNMLVEIMNGIEASTRVETEDWLLHQIDTNNSYSVGLNAESANMFTDPVRMSEPSEFFTEARRERKKLTGGYINEPEVISMDDEELENASSMYYENMKNNYIGEMRAGEQTPSRKSEAELEEGSLEDEPGTAAVRTEEEIDKERIIVEEPMETPNLEYRSNMSWSKPRVDDLKPENGDPLSYLDTKLPIADQSPLKPWNDTKGDNLLGHTIRVVNSERKTNGEVSNALNSGSLHTSTKGPVLEVSTRTDEALDAYKALYEKEQQSHKKTTLQLYTITHKYDELVDSYHDLKDQLAILSTPKPDPVYLIEEFDEQFLRRLFTERVTFETYKEVMARCGRMEDYDREKFIYDLKFLVTTENVLDYLSPENYESFLCFVLHMVITSTRSEGSSGVQSLMHRILDASIKIQNMSMVVYSLINILNKEVVMGSALDADTKMTVMLGLKCIEKLLDYTKSNQAQVMTTHDVFSVLKSLHFFFKDHPPERLTSETEDLAFYDDIFRQLKEAADRLINLQPGQARVFLTVFGEDQSVFIAYIKRVVTSLDQN